MRKRMKWVSVLLALAMIVTTITPFSALATDDLLDFSSSPAATPDESAGPVDQDQTSGNDLGENSIEFILEAENNTANTPDNPTDLKKTDVQVSENVPESEGNNTEQINDVLDEQVQSGAVEAPNENQDINNEGSEGDNNTPGSDDVTSGGNESDENKGQEGGASVPENTITDIPVDTNVPEENTLTEVITPAVDFTNAITESNVRSSSNETVKNGDTAEFDVTLATGMALNRVRLTFRAANLDLNEIHVRGFDKGGAVYSAYKLFLVKYNDNGEAKSKYFEMPLFEGVSSDEAKKITDADKEYASFEGAIEGAEASFAGEYYIDLVGAPSGIKGTISVKGTVNSPEKENPSLTGVATVFLGESSENIQLGTSRYEYLEETISEEPVDDTTDEPEEDNPATDTEPAEDNDEPAGNAPSNESKTEEGNKEPVSDVSENVPDAGKDMLNDVTDNDTTVQIAPAATKIRTIKGAPALKGPKNATLTIKAYCGENEPVAGTVFNVKPEEGDTQATEATNNAGVTTISLPVGTYTVSVKEDPTNQYSPSGETSQSVALTENKDITFTFVKQTQNPTTGSITFCAVDSKNREKRLNDVTIQIKNEAGNTLSGTTTIDGTKRFDNVSFGTWSVYVIGVPNGYKTNMETVYGTVTINEEKPTVNPVTLSINPIPTKGTITVTAKDADTYEGIKGITFSLLKNTTEKEKVTEDVKTDEDGKAVFADIDVGNYLVHEKSGVPEYVSMNEDKEVDLDSEEQPFELLYSKKVPGTIQIYAYEEKTDPQEPVEFVTFTLQSKTDAKDYATNADGELVIQPEPGTYTLTLAGVPSEYMKPIYSEPVTVELGSIFNLNVPLTRNTDDNASIVITVLDSETKKPIQDVTVIATPNDGSEKPITYTEETNENGVAEISCLPGDYSISLTGISPNYKVPEISLDVSLSPYSTFSYTFELEPIPEEITIESLDGLAFDPEEQTVVPTSGYTMNLDNYSLVLSDPEATAGTVKFAIEPVDSNMQLRALFDGKAFGYKVNAVNANGESEEVYSDFSGIVDFDSTNLEYYDPETGEAIPEKKGKFPEGTKYVWIYVYDPDPDFAVNTFTVSGVTDKDFTEKTFTATTTVFGFGEEPAEVKNTGKITKGEPTGDITITASSSRKKVGENIDFTVAYTNTSETPYSILNLDIVGDSDLFPKNLNPGKWENYDGKISVFSYDSNNKETLVATATDIGPITWGASSEPVRKIEIRTCDPCEDVVQVSNVVLTGTYNKEGSVHVHAEVKGIITEVGEWTDKTEEIGVEIEGETPQPEPVGIISAMVKNEDGKPISGVMFNVTNESGEVTTIMTNEEGIASDQFPVGKYRLEAVVDTQEYTKEFTLGEGEVQSPDFVMILQSRKEPVVEKGTLVIDAVVEGTAEPVADVEIALFQKSSETESRRIGTGKTNAEGKLTVEGLEEGDNIYIVRVTSVPTGYEESTFENDKVSIRANETTNIKIEVKKKEEVTPTPTPSTGPDPLPPGGGGGGGGSVTPTPEPEADPMYLDSPKITSNTSSIAYGNDALFYVRGLNAGGMEETDYYVLHIMIPEGLQVKTITFPGFGTEVRATLTYGSGTTQLGVYDGPGTENLTDRQGTGLRYIAFQIHGVTTVTTTGDIELLVKDISARDRIVTLQAILSLRDSATIVISDALNQKGQIKPKRNNIPDGMTAQKNDRYNISLAGPKGGSSSGSSSSSSSVSKTTELTMAERAKTCYPQLSYPAFAKAQPVRVLKVPSVSKPRVSPLLFKMKNDRPVVLSVNAEQISSSSITDALIRAAHKQHRDRTLQVLLDISKMSKTSILR